MAYRRTPATQERLDATRAGIVEAATRLVADAGYAGCSMAAVATEAGVATGTVYRHFPNKGALFAEVFRTATQREVAAVHDAATGPGPVAARAEAALTAFAKRALAAPRLAFALLAEPVDPAVEAERLLFRRAYREIFADLIAEGVASGELPPQDPQVSAAAAVGALGEALVLPLAEGDASRRTLPDLLAFTLRALGADSLIPTTDPEVTDARHP